jgi:hypothetical protein
MTAVRAKSHLIHLKKNSTLDGFESIPGIREGARINNRVGVFQEGVPHFISDIGVNNPWNL